MVGFLKVKLIPCTWWLLSPVTFFQPPNADNLTAKSIVIGECVYVLLWLKNIPKNQKAFGVFHWYGEELGVGPGTPKQFEGAIL